MFKKFLLLILLVSSISAVHAQTVAYVTNFASNSVSVIDTSINTVIATVGVGSGPNGVVASPDSTRIYVSNFNAGSISVIDTATNTVTATFPLPGTIPAYLAITPDGKNLYVPDLRGGVLVVNTADGSVAAAIPVAPNTFAAVVTPDGARVYVTSFPGTGLVSVIATVTNTVVGPPIPFPGSFNVVVPAIAITPAGNDVYVAGDLSNALSRIATSTNTIDAVLPFPAGVEPVAIAPTPDGGHFYVALFNTPAVAVFATSTNALTTVIGVGPDPSALAVTPDGGFVYVTNAANGTVSAIATASNTVTATIPVGASPFGIAIATLGTAISKCPTVISQPGTYFVANDLFCFGTDGIDIRADNVTLRLGNHRIIQDVAHFGLARSGVSVGVGIPSGNSNVQIFGPGTITGFSSGVNFEQVSSSLVKSVTSTGNFFGFVVNGGFAAGCAQACPSTNNVFHGNTSTANNQHGFTLNGAANNIFSSNIASSNGARGILLFVAAGNDLRANTTNGNGQSGIEIAAGTGTGNNLHQNTAQNNGLVDLEDDNPNCDSNTWKQNTFGTASQPCIQ